MDPALNFFGKFFGVVARPRTYLNNLYLLLSFPLGLFYFVFLVTGLSLGISLTIIWVGLLILALVYGIWYALVAFERQMAITMLGEDIPPMLRQDLSGKNLWQKFTATLGSPVTWKGLLYLFLKFPLGLFSFVVWTVLISLSASLLAAPFYYRWVTPQITDIRVNGVLFSPVWRVDTLGEALVVALIGALVLLISMHILNGLAYVSGKFAKVMLGNFSAQPAAIAASAAAAPAAVVPLAPVEPVLAAAVVPQEPVMAAPAAVEVVDAPAAVETSQPGPAPVEPAADGPSVEEPATPAS